MAPQFASPLMGSRIGDPFSQVVAGSGDPIPKSRIAQIALNRKTHMKEWLRKSVLIGEAHNLDHIGNVPTSLLMRKGTKYLGGLNISLHFSHSWMHMNSWKIKKDEEIGLNG
ncbi:unnamed protein product [Lactuca virosa]|uniref:Uncharacterized protein n=1 Tax=Lactuca virosa TaxID=75947 RepID=A0AAU9P597_9ASTR|nr:unnamed protein product [Lactuca virosa]